MSSLLLRGLWSALGLIASLMTLSAQASPPPPTPAGLNMVDAQASRQTRALYTHLHRLSQQGIMLFGHQDDLAYGVHWRKEAGRSDVRESTGSHPALYGWELSKLGQRPYNIDSVDFEDMRRWIIEAYERGGINTLSWHLDNPVSGGDSWDTTLALATILPGGEHHAWYRSRLDHFATFANSLQAGGLFKTTVPIILRLFHEQSGSWFWWGNNHCSAEDYRALWRFTVSYLRDEKKLHHLIYAYATDVVADSQAYLSRYPGDDYVDIMGIDDYHDVSGHGDPRDLTTRLRWLVHLAEARGKVPALTETGQERIEHDYFWTKTLLAHIQADSVARRIAYVMVWRNARPNHHYAPFPGHPSRPDFVLFRHREGVWFENDLPNLYKLP